MKVSKKLDEIFCGTVNIDNKSGCWIWIAAHTKYGYGNVKWRGKNYPAHRLSWNLHCGEIPNGLHVLHKCDNRSCVNPNHLFLGTQKDNMEDMDKKGRRIHWRSQNLYKLSERDFDKIRELYSAGNVTQTEIGIKYNISVSSISRIIRFQLQPKKSRGGAS